MTKMTIKMILKPTDIEMIMTTMKKKNKEDIGKNIVTDIIRVIISTKINQKIMMTKKNTEIIQSLKQKITVTIKKMLKNNY